MTNIFHSTTLSGFLFMSAVSLIVFFAIAFVFVKLIQRKNSWENQRYEGSPILPEGYGESFICEYSDTQILEGIAEDGNMTLDELKASLRRSGPRVVLRRV